MKSKLVVFLFLSCLVSSTSLFSQSAIYKFGQKKDGLLHSFILSLFQDSRGYLWIGTSGGLHRYDGYNLKTYTRETDSLGLSNSAIRDIFEDREGNIWLATEYGLNEIVWKTDSIIKYFHQDNNPNSLSLNHLRTVYQDKDGIFWIGTYNGGLDRFNPKTGQFKHYVHQNNNPHSIGSNKINAFLCDKKGNFWLGTEDGGLSLFDPKKEVFYNFSSDDKDPNGLNDKVVNCIFEDKKGFLWLGTWQGGLNRFDPRTKTFTNYKQLFQSQLHYDAGPIRAIQQDADGNLWLASFHEGLIQFHPETKQIKVFNIKENALNAINSNDLWALLIDKSNVLWVGTFGNYLNYLDLNQSKFKAVVKQENTDNTISDNTIYAMREDSKGMLWIATKKVVDCYDPKTKQYRHFLKQQHDNQYFSCLFEDRQGRLWIGKDGELIRMEQDRKSYITYKGANTAGKLGKYLVRDIEQDQQGNIWISQYDRGVYLLTVDEINKKNPEEAVFKNFRSSRTKADSLKVDLVWDIFKDREGELWLASSTVLSRWDAKHQGFVHYEQFTSPSCFYQDPSGVMWIGSYGNGLYRFDKKTGKVENVKSKDYLLKIIFGIIADQDGYLWISSSKGLHRMDVKTREIINFDENDGLLSNEANPFAFARLRSGEIIYGTKCGYNIFRPEQMHPNSYSPQPVLTDFLLFNQSVTIENRLNAKPFLKKRLSETSEIVLDYQQNVFSIEFSSLYFSDPEHNLFAYKLEGFDKDWIYTSSGKRLATYTNLSPGKYHFMVRSANSDGIWNPKPTTIQLTILPPWWRTWWAMLVYFLLSILAMYIFRRMILYKERMVNILKIKDIEFQKQKEIEEMKMNFFTNISHELRTPLTLILGPAEQLMDEHRYPAIRNHLSIIHRNAKNMLQLVNQLLDFRKVESGQMNLSVSEVDLVLHLKMIVSNFTEYAAQKEVSLEFESEYETLDAWIDTDLLNKVLFNLLSNALKFTESGGEVCLKLEMAGYSPQEKPTGIAAIASIQVRDTGIGIPKEQQAHVFNRFYQLNSSAKNQGSGVGLALTKELVERHKGRISLSSQPQEGSVFTVELPIDKSCYLSSELNQQSSDKAKMLEELPYDKNKEGVLKHETNTGKLKSKKTVLLIDDNDDILSFLSLQLKDSFQLLFASDGEEGIAKAKEFSPDLIVSDVMMPKMDGLELCRLIKTNQATSHIPIILLTAKNSDTSKIEAYQTGADSYITKPFNAQILLAKINSMLSNRASLLEMFLKDQHAQPKVLASTEIDEVFISKVTKTIESRIDDPDLNAEFIGREVGVSRTLLYNKLNSLTDQSVNEFVKSIRLRRAALLLEEGHRVTEVAYMVGFRSQSYFTRSFIKQYNISPSAWAGR